MQNAELHRARNELEAALARYTDLYDFAPVGYFTLTPKGVVQMVNLTGARLVGIERSRLLGLSFASLLSAQDRAGFESFLKATFADSVKQTGEFELASKRRPARTVSVEAQVMRDGMECRAVVVDVTARTQAELAASRLASLVESSVDAIVGMDLTGTVTSWNRGAENIFGYSADEIIGSAYGRLIPADRRDEENHLLGQLRRGSGAAHLETVRRTKSGRLIDVSVTASPIRDPRGRLQGISKVSRDITDRKNAERILQRNEALFTSLVAQAPVGVYVVNARFQMQQVNPKALPVFANALPLIGRDLSEILRILWPRKIADGVLGRFRHTLKTGEPYQSPEFKERRRDTGKAEIYEWQIRRITLPAGEYGVVCFFNDVTERKKAEASERRLAVLAASNQKLEQEVARRRQVEGALRQSAEEQVRLLERARQLSHQVLHAQEAERKRISRELHDEIAQTLVSVSVHLSGLTREVPGASRQLGKQIARTQRLVEKSVDDVHRFARDLRPTALDDLGLVPALHAFMKEFTKRTGVLCHLTAHATLAALGIEERTALYRVAQEALSNVARHARASRVTVKLERQQDCICMTIRDDGKSFPVQRTLEAGGTKRLGLLGMKERLDMIGGSLAIESKRGDGTLITAKIPLRASGQAKRRSTKSKGQ